MIRRTFHVAGLVCLFLMATSAAQAGLPDTIVKLKPSVVLIGTFKATDSPRFQLRGTGFIVGNGQLVVTNAHVLPTPAGGDAPALVVQVRQASGEWQMRPAASLEANPAHDLALLRMEGPPGTAARLGDSNTVREGDDLAFMGFPIGGVLGFSPVTHRATVSSITPAALPSPSAGRLSEMAIRGLRNGTFNIFQLDATAYPGNSGGPLFDPETGDVLGVLNMVLIKGTRESALSQPSGISYAIPGVHVREMLDRHR
ncbi:MAG: serine protease [Hydrogenophaga sp.]|uniref:S1 family peptidase n=1 Tax=Hydrogenophaga sp. TaxID=1904254 RepID=UPI0027348A5C|nr:serine protease [Hydrogenophaga sp.]MDP2986430.1 serine protease [Hydrogenophaga sp.]MDP3205824.1 serine protease [Hydrogenophaga sp.]MDP3626891.1 serine protease [Hydrogenophaga sp.]